MTTPDPWATYTNTPRNLELVETVDDRTGQAEPADILRGIFTTHDALNRLPWPAPNATDTGPLPTFPVDTLPGEISEYVAALAEYQQLSVDIIALVALGALSVVAGGYATVTGQWTEKTLNLYLAPLADSGEGKSPAVAAIAAPIYHLERELRGNYDAEYKDKRERYEIALKTRERLISKLADASDKAKYDDLMAQLDAINSEIEANKPPPRPQLLAGDVTPESLGRVMSGTGGHIGMLADEGSFLGTLAGRYSKGVANIDLILISFDAQMPYRVERIGRDPFEIDRPSLSMCLCVQPVVVAEAVQSAALVDRGLINRFIFARPESLAGHRNKRPPKVPGHLHAAWARRIRMVFDTLLPDGSNYDKDTGETRPPLDIEVSEAAEDLHYDWRVTLERRVDPDEGDLAEIKGWVKKLEGAVYRIAALLHLASGAHPQELISVDTMLNAIRIGEWAIPHARAVLSHTAAASGHAGGVETEQACQHVLGWIRRKGRTEFTVRDVHSALKSRTWVKQGGADSIRIALVELARRGYLTSVERRNTAGKLQPDGLFVAHPDISFEGP